MTDLERFRMVLGRRGPADAVTLGMFSVMVRGTPLGRPVDANGRVCADQADLAIRELRGALEIESAKPDCNQIGLILAFERLQEAQDRRAGDGPWARITRVVSHAFWTVTALLTAYVLWLTQDRDREAWRRRQPLDFHKDPWADFIFGTITALIVLIGFWKLAGSQLVWLAHEIYHPSAR